MSNDLIARLRARRAHGIVGGTQLVVSTNPDALCTEAADALEQQDAIIAGLRSDDATLTGENEAQAREIEADKHNQRAYLALFAEADAQIEALRADAARLRGDNDVLRKTLAAIKSHCQPQPSALAAAIVATCEAVLQASGKAVTP